MARISGEWVSCSYHWLTMNRCLFPSNRARDTLPVSVSGYYTVVECEHSPHAHLFLISLHWGFHCCSQQLFYCNCAFIWFIEILKEIIVATTSQYCVLYLSEHVNIILSFILFNHLDRVNFCSVGYLLIFDDNHNNQSQTLLPAHVVGQHVVLTSLCQAKLN